MPTGQISGSSRGPGTPVPRQLPCRGNLLFFLNCACGLLTAPHERRLSLSLASALLGDDPEARAPVCFLRQRSLMKRAREPKVTWWAWCEGCGQRSENL